MAAGSFRESPIDMSPVRSVGHFSCPGCLSPPSCACAPVRPGRIDTAGYQSGSPERARPDRLIASTVTHAGMVNLKRESRDLLRVTSPGGVHLDDDFTEDIVPVDEVQSFRVSANARSS